MKRERRVQPNSVKLGVNKKIGHINKTIGQVSKKNGHVNETLQYKVSEINNTTTMCADTDRQTSSAYDTKGEEKTSSNSESNEKACGCYVCIHEYFKNFCCSTYRRV